MRNGFHWRTWIAAAALAVPLAFGAAAPRAVAGGCGCQDDDDHDDADVRESASQQVVLKKSTPKKEDSFDVKLLGINDFHGQISAGKRVSNRPVGSAPVLASYLLAAAQGWDGHLLLVHAGDHVGASPASSALLQDEPSITFLNIMNEKLGGNRGDHWEVLGTLGNHEFDEGRAELFRLLYGGNFATGPFLEKKWKGADYPMISANVIDTASGDTILPPTQVRKIDGVTIGFVGAVTKTTPTIVTADGVKGLTFLDEADAINAQVAKLKKDGVKAIVVLVHEGGFQTSFTGPTPALPGQVSGAIVPIVKKLDDEVDVVVSGHTHLFTNSIIQNDHGKPILVVQAFSSGTAYDDITLTLDRSTKDVAAATASIVTTWADTGAGLTPDPDVAALTKAAEDKVAPLVNRVIGTAASPLDRTQDSAGESNLGDLIADAQRASMGADFAFMNPGGIRADLLAGQVTWGDLFSVQPFANYVVKLTLTGAQIDALLEQQFQVNRVLAPSGLTYTWDNSKPVGSRVDISQILKNGVPISAAGTYTVAVNSFLAGGGDGFTVLTGGTGKVVGPIDLDALVAYIQGLTQPFPAPVTNRITRLN
jgi:5'-nucleotidase